MNKDNEATKPTARPSLGGSELTQLLYVESMARNRRNTNMNIQDTELQIEELNFKLEPLIRKKQELNRRLRQLKSIDYIDSKGIKKDDVESCTGDDRPWFGTITSFTNWLKMNSTKKYCDWNGWIYEISELIEGRMDQNPLGMCEDLDV